MAAAIAAVPPGRLSEKWTSLRLVSSPALTAAVRRGGKPSTAVAGRRLFRTDIGSSESTLLGAHAGEESTAVNPAGEGEEGRPSQKDSPPTRRGGRAADQRVTHRASPSDTAVASAPRRRRRAHRGRGASKSLTRPGEDSDPASAVAAAAKRKMEEDDVRLTVRMLMMRHFSQRYAMRQPQEMKLEEEREQLRRKLESRERRIAAKNRNSMRLLAEDAVAVGDGIVPLFAQPSQNPYSVTAGGEGAAVPARAWMMPNPVGLAVAATSADEALAGSAVAEEEEEGGGGGGGLPPRGGDHDDVLTGGASLFSLTRPDMSMYDSAHDFRVRSEDVARAEESLQRRAAVAEEEGPEASPPASVDDSTALKKTVAQDDPAEAAVEWTALSMDDRRATSLLREELLADEEDADFTVRLYHQDDTDL